MTQNNKEKYGCIVGLSIAILLQSAVFAADATSELHSPNPAQRRAAVLKIIQQKPADCVQLLSPILQDENVVVRRSVARGLKERGVEAKDTLVTALSNSDALVRLTAFNALKEQNVLTMEQIAAASKDQASAVLRQSAVQVMVELPQTGAIRKLLEQATTDPSKEVRTIASQSLYAFSFFRKVESIRDDADQIIRISKNISLPMDGWKLKFDPQQKGHAKTEHWFDPDLNDQSWTDVSIGQLWDGFGFKDQTGIGWYRRRFTLPEKPKLDAVEICFEAVDESAWVWINGEYAGQHDIGPIGYQSAFWLDITEFVKWEAENQITVRVLNKIGAGGIYKPVKIEVLSL